MQSTFDQKLCSNFIMNLLLLYILLFPNVFCLKLLFIPAHSSASHSKSMYPVAETLARAGHQVVFWQILTDESQKASNSLFENRYLITKTKQVNSTTASELNAGGFFWASSAQLSVSFFFPWVVMTKPCVEVLESVENLGLFLATVNERWDYIFVDNVFAACGYLAVQLNGARWINFATSTAVPTSQEFKGLPIWPSVVPSSKLDGSTDLTSFKARLTNSVNIWIINVILHSMDYYLPWSLNHELAKNISYSLFQKDSTFAILSFAPELETGKPMIHSLLEIDTSCPQATPLPEPYKSFVENPQSKGTILLAFGHLVLWDTAPEQVKHAVHQALEELVDYRIIWQYSYANPMNKPNCSDHIMLVEWIPQYAVLSHPKTLTFISHLGAKSFRESICAKVPLVSMPLFAEQFRNSAIVRRKKIGIFLGKSNLDKNEVLRAINTVITNQDYKRNIGRLQGQMDDKLMKPSKMVEWFLGFVDRKPYVVQWMKHKGPSIKLYRFKNDLEISAILFAVFILIKVLH